MKKLILILTMLPTISFAEDLKFVPYTITQEDHTKFMNYLGEQPAKFSIPIIQALNSLEQKALDEAKKKEVEKKEPVK